MTEMKTLWGPRFREAPDPALTEISRSPPSHYRLVPYDIASSKAHAGELLRAAILTKTECARICSALDIIKRECADGLLTPKDSDEDVHSFIERELIERLGAIGGKLRAGRSRNDQAANNLKLYLRVEARALARRIIELQRCLISQARQHVTTFAPGFTHLQPGQPIAFAHQLLAHAQAYGRDIDRLKDWDRRAAFSPLGAAALAGSAITRTPEIAARELGYDGAMENSIDAVGSRDHVCEFLFVAAMFATHVSRLAEEIVLWSSAQFRWIQLSDAFSTGSSIMPQKKNADIAEIARGRSSVAVGNLNSMLSILKGLPFSYNRDLFIDKELAFNTIDMLHMVVPAMCGIVRTFVANETEMRRQAGEGFILATEVADYLARRGVAFNEAHAAAGALVKLCEDKQVALNGAAEDDLRAIHPLLDRGIREALSVESAVHARNAYGGTAPERVIEQLERLVARTDSDLTWAQIDPLARRT